MRVLSFLEQGAMGEVAAFGAIAMAIGAGAAILRNSREDRKLPTTEFSNRRYPLEKEKGR